METVRLLGGSWHGRKMQLRNPVSDIFMVKKPKKKKLPPMLFSADEDAIFVTDNELYQRRYIRNVTAAADPDKWIVETRVAYIKKDSNVKRGTFWNLAFTCDTRLTNSYELM